MHKTYIIGDVHGCYHTLVKLIEKLQKNSRIIFVGDLVDKGNYSKEVVEFVIQNNYESILGNHEHLMLQHIQSNKTSKWSTERSFGGYKTIQSYKNDSKTLKKHLLWMSALPRYIQIEQFFITHAFALPYFKRKDKPTSYQALMSNRPSDKDKWGFDWEDGYESYGIINIFGHDVVEKIDTTKNYIGIDTGCVYGKKLSAIELGSLEVISVEVEAKDIKD